MAFASRKVLISQSNATGLDRGKGIGGVINQLEL
jgi:hypothetical protein